MTPDRWARIKEVFGEAEEKPEADRSAYLDAACVGDSGLRREVERLLREAASERFERPAWTMLASDTLKPGAEVGPYQIVGVLGAGGMGQVYQARDPRLGRTVAIKVSALEFSRRFEREARAVAAFNHPHICTIYDVGPNYLVMEYVDGSPLRGPLPAAEAVRYAIQLASALDAAHRKGIVHRDLKPANVLLGKSGVKVLDFGLAKMEHTSAPFDETVTQKGTILGTPHYMSPEQVQGKETDGRSDIFSFGVMFYEILAGRRPFEGDNAASVMAATLTAEPAPLAPATVPPALDRVLRRCLAKDPDERWRTASDLQAALELIGSQSIDPVPVPRPVRPVRLNRVWGSLLAVGLLVAGLAISLHRAPLRALPMARFEVQPPQGEGTVHDVALSPDGKTLAYVARGKLRVRPLDSLEVRDVAEATGSVFWSPDGRSVAYASPGGLARTEPAGGEQRILWPHYIQGGTWNPSGVLVLGRDRLVRMSAEGGGTPTEIYRGADGANAQSWPQFLPDGRHFLYLAPYLLPRKSAVYIGSLDGDAPSRLLETPYRAVYAPGEGDAAEGALLFVRGDDLVAQRFSATNLKLRGEPVVLAHSPSVDPVFRYLDVAASTNGVLAYATGGARRQRLAWFDRAGKRLGPLGEAAYPRRWSVAPDGGRVAVLQDDPDTGLANIWLLEAARGLSTRITLGESDSLPIWSPDGKQIAWGNARKGIYRTNSHGGAPELLLAGHQMTACSWAPDGRALFYELRNSKDVLELWVLPLPAGAGGPPGQPYVYLAGAVSSGQPMVSPDGKWVAYVAWDSAAGRARAPHVFVQPFPATGARWQVSPGDGVSPKWRGDGRELFYEHDGRVMSVAVRVSGTEFVAAAPQPLLAQPAESVWFDVSRDGQRFLVLEDDRQGSRPAVVMMHWQQMLR